MYVEKHQHVYGIELVWDLEQLGCLTDRKIDTPKYIEITNNGQPMLDRLIYLGVISFLQSHLGFEHSSYFGSSYKELHVNNSLYPLVKLKRHDNRPFRDSDPFLVADEKYKLVFDFTAIINGITFTKFESGNKKFTNVFIHFIASLKASERCTIMKVNKERYKECCRGHFVAECRTLGNLEIPKAEVNLWEDYLKLGKYYTMSRTMEQVLSCINPSVLDTLYCDFVVTGQDSKFFSVKTLAIELNSKD
jgi:hypothetical protein